MDICAELTLRIARLSQEALNPHSSAVGWCFFPESRHVAWADARDRLVATPKPLVVAPFVEPGSIGVWSLGELPAEAQAALGHEFANQAQYFRAKLERLALGDGDAIELPGPVEDLVLGVPDFCRWFEAYALMVGIGMQRSARGDRGRLLIRPPGGGQPIGWEPPPARTA